MKRCSLIILVFSATMFFINSGSAQSFASKGTVEIGGTISYNSTTSVSNGETSDNSLGVFSLDVPIYYFVVDGLEAGLIPSYQNYSYGESSTSLFKLLVGVAYNVKTNSTAYPFFEGRVGFNTASNGETKSGLVWAVIAGVKVQVAGNTLLNFGVGYTQNTLEDNNDQNGRSGTDVIEGRAGFTIFFGG